MKTRTVPKTFALLVVLSLAAACEGVHSIPLAPAASTTATPTPGSYPDLSISMQVSSTGMSAPEQWVIDGSGNLRYWAVNGFSSTGRPVMVSATMTPDQIETLVESIERADIWDMLPSYSEGCIACPLLRIGVTLNGRTQMVAYWGSSECDPSFAGSAPRALCMLRDDIRYIGLAAFPAAAFRSTPTPIPSSMPVPLVLSDDLGILSAIPCGPPCFMGIRPGVTTFDDAVQQLRGMGLVDHGLDVTPSGKTFRVSNGDALITIGTGDLCTGPDHSPLVGAISLTLAHPITQGDFIKQYGRMDALKTSTGVQSILGYSKLPVFLFVPGAEPTSIGVPNVLPAPEMPIDTIVYVSADEYRKCIASWDSHSGQWNGMSTYVPAPAPRDLRDQGFGTPWAPTATLSPTPTPAPILRSGDFGILSDAPCGPPCLLDVQTGVTTFENAIRLLAAVGLRGDAVDVKPSGQELTFHGGEAWLSVGTVGSCTQHDYSPYVGRMLLTPPDKITVGEFIARYGPPDSITLGEGSGPDAMLPYGSLQAFAFLEPGGLDDATPRYTVASGTKIIAIIYMTADEYPTCLAIGKDFRQPWKGYGTYALNP